MRPNGPRWRVVSFFFVIEQDKVMLNDISFLSFRMLFFSFFAFVVFWKTRQKYLVAFYYMTCLPNYECYACLFNLVYELLMRAFQLRAQVNEQGTDTPYLGGNNI